MSQELEPSLHDYARFYGLTRDHLDSYPLAIAPGPIDVWQQLNDLPDLFHIDSSKAYFATERIAIDPAAASFLAAITTQKSEQAPWFDQDNDVTTRRFRDSKIELPLLRTDHDLDILRFRRQAQPDLESEFLPIETVDEEADEGLAWPSRMSEAAEGYWDKVLSEKFPISSDTLGFLQRALQWHEEGGDCKSFQDIDGESSYERNKLLEPVTPPMVPMSPEILPYEPPSETGQLRLLPEVTSPATEELREAETAVFRRDSIFPFVKLEASSSQCSERLINDSDSLGDIYSPLKGIQDPPSSSPPTRLLVQDHKIEVPLSPPIADELPPWSEKYHSLREAITGVVPDMPILIPASESNPEDIDTFFEQSIAPIARVAEQSIEHEQLQESDTTLRVNVPVMDFSRPEPPWEYNSVNMTMKKIADELIQQQACGELKKPYWRLSSKVERGLTWVVFSIALARVEPQERIIGDGSEAEFIRRPECVDPEKLIWKSNGLRIFDEIAESDEDELEEGIFPDGRDLASLIGKRKLELEEEAEDIEGMSADTKRTFDIAGSRQQHRSQKPIFPMTTQNTSNFLQDTGFSAFNALDDYVAVRNGEMSSSIMEQPDTASSMQRHGVTMSIREEDPAVEPVICSTSDLARESIKMPYPAFSLPHETRSFIWSTTFLQDRGLIRNILKLYPTADIIERDWTTHSQIDGVLSAEHHLAVERNSMGDEADIIISPSTGLIITLLQKLKQRSLPGQSSHSSLRDRICNAAPRYEQLLVFVYYDYVTLGLENENLSIEDSHALADFTAYCSNLPSDFSVTLVAGGEEQLAHWVVASMVQHSVADCNFQLIQDEMPAELFLRRAGFNVFAAQAIIQAVSGNQDQSVQRQAQALSIFVQMSLYEKLARFSRLLGGERMLGRVHSVFEARW